MTKAKKWWQGLNATTQNVAKAISALLVIGGALLGTATFFQNQVEATIGNAVAPLHAQNEETRLALMRVEIRQLIQTEPTDIVNIESMTKEYLTRGGNHDIRRLYSTWCQQYDPEGCHIALISK
jgi:hypothetical protein